MLRWILVFVVCIASLILFENIWAFPEQWKYLSSSLSLYTIMHDQGGKLISTSASSAPNDKTLLITYWQTKKDLYRCVESKDYTLTTVVYYCEMLIKPEY